MSALLTASAGINRDDTGRLLVTEDGTIVAQVARKGEIPNMLGAAASNNVELAKKLPPEQLSWKDKLGRTPLMLAAWFKSYEMLDWLSTQLRGDTWQLDARFSKEARVNSSFPGLNLETFPELTHTHQTFLSLIMLIPGLVGWIFVRLKESLRGQVQYH
jgi:hypothetical protein